MLNSLSTCARCGAMALVACTGWTASAFSADRDTRVEFAIHEQSADKALTEFARQAGLSVLFPYDAVSLVTANQLVGNYRIAEGLEVLLARTGLQATLDNNNGLTVRVQDPGGETEVETRKRGFAALLSGVASALGIGAGSVTAQPAPSEEGGESQVFEEVLVTGSRIVRRDFVANSPIQTLEKDAFEQQSAIGLESALNDLPQFVPGATGLSQMQDQSQFDVNLTTLTAGASTISLRGLGANRNLVLLDGRRVVPVNATMAVDLNSIPAAAIQRVEVITGGASSVYGPDAVAGVVNFILKRDFEGVDVDLQYGNMTNGEAPETRASILFGVNSADGRGNVMIGVEAAKREAVHYDDVDFYRYALRDPEWHGRAYSGAYYNISAANLPNGAVIDGIFDQAPPGVVLRNATTGAVQGRVYWNDDGSLYSGGRIVLNPSPAGQGSSAGVYRYTGPFSTARDNALEAGEYPFRKIDQDGHLAENQMTFEANIPLDRRSAFGRGEYELTDRISAFVQVMAVEGEVRRMSSLTPATGGWGLIAPYGTEMYAPSLNADGTTRAAYLPGGQYGLDCEADGVPGCTESEAWPVPPELKAVLDSRRNPNENWSLNYFLDFVNYGVADTYTHTIINESRTNEILVGLSGDLDVIDGHWDIAVSRGKSKNDAQVLGYASVERLRTVMTRSPNWGYGFFVQGNSIPPGNGFGGGVVTCTSGMPVFRSHDQVSRDCLDAVFVEMSNQSEMDQEYIEANIEGHLVEMPAGEARFSAGYHSRENSYYFMHDPLQTLQSFLDNAMDFPKNNSTGATAVDEIYGELLLPLLQGKPGVQHLNLELGYRYSEYEYQGGVDTYKALIDWGITDTLRFRGGSQLATRAPNIAEMFQADSQNWYTSGTGEPCGLLSNAPYGANSARNPNYQQAIDLCSARMGEAAAQDFYAPGATQPNGSSWTPTVNATGNPLVNPEEAESWTAGFVYQPNTGRELLDGLTASVDWYSIRITDMISVEPAELVYEQCLSVDTNPSGDPSHPSCLRVHRNPGTGAAAPTTVSYINAAFAEIAGTDISLDWRADLFGGLFGVNFTATLLRELNTQATAATPVLDWKGSLGPDSGTSLNNGAYDYRTFTTVRYGRNDWNLSLRWRHLPSAIDQTQVVSTTSTQLGAEESYDVFDLTGTWDVGSRTTLRFGIENLFDADPVWTGARTQADPFPTSGSGETEAGFYDILGRQFFLGVSASF